MALIGEMRYLQIGGNTYEIPTSELPIASSSTLGGIKVGTNLSIDSSTGVLSVTGIPTKISDITAHDNFGIGYIDCNSSDRNIFVSNVKFGTAGSSDYSSPFLLMFQKGSASYGTVTISGKGSFHFYDINTNRLLNYQTSVNYTNLQYGKLYIAYMSDNVLTIKSIAETTDIPTIPTNISAFTNDAGYITGYTETDPVFSASAAAGITATDITNWNSKVSDTGKWNNVSLAKQQISDSAEISYIPLATSISPIIMSFSGATRTPTANYLVKYDQNGYLNSTTPSANDNSTKVATTAYVDAAIPAISITRNLTSGTKSATINISGTDYDIYSTDDTKNTAGSTDDTTNSLYIIGATSQGANPQTYSNKNFHIRGLYLYLGYNGTTKATGLCFYYGNYYATMVYGGTVTGDTYTPILKFSSVTSENGVILRNIANPRNNEDAVNKLYVDTRSLPTGGAAGQVLKKTSSTDYAVEWGAVDALPSITSSDNNKVLMVVNGAWAAASLPIYNGGVS